jgi:hypothetical protein
MQVKKVKKRTHMLYVADAIKDHRQRSRLCELQGYF